MIHFVTALHCEAKPIIKHYNLIRDIHSAKFEIYKSDEASLIISGTGMFKSAVAAAHLFSVSPDTKNSIAVNIGICGSSNAHYEKGKLFVINKIINHSLKKSYYPDIIIKHGLSENSLETFPAPVTINNHTAISGELVDMEAAGFMEAASMFFASHNIYCLKVVSDHLEGERITPGFVSGLVEQNLDSLSHLVESAAALSHSNNDVLTAEDMDIIEKISLNLNLTVTLRHQLKNLAVHYKIRSKGDLGLLKSFEDISTNKKDERKRYFESIKKLLAPG